MKFTHIHQSKWLKYYLNKNFDNKLGVFLEIGVGNIISHDFCVYPEKYKEKKWNELPIIGSNTIELLQIGWQGYYFDPVPLFVEQAKLLAPDKNKIYTKAVGLGKNNEEKFLRAGDTFLERDTQSIPNVNWINKTYKIQNANEALLESNIPNFIDFFSLDVEGYELNILESIDFNKYKFNLVFVEVERVTLEGVANLLPNYKCIEYDQSNALFQHNEFSK